MIIFLNSGLMKYITTLSVLTVLFAFLINIIGIIGFIFFAICFCLIGAIFYFFRSEERIIKEGLYVSPTDGRVNNISKIDILPDIIDNNSKYNNYTVINMTSNLNNIYFKYSPCDGTIINIKTFFPGSIGKASNFIHTKHKNHLVMTIMNEKKENVFLIFELLFLDKNHNLYTLYVENGTKIKKGDMLLCAHFYSKIFLYIPQNKPLKIQSGQSLLYKETVIY